MGGAPWAKRPLGGSAGRAHRKIYFLSNRKEKKNYGKKYGEGIWPAGPGPYRIRKKEKMGRPLVL